MYFSRQSGWSYAPMWSRRGHVTVRVPLKMDDVSIWERVISAAAVSERGSKLRPYGAFISHLTTYEATSEIKSSLLLWAPTAVMELFDNTPGAYRRAIPGKLSENPDPVDARDSVEGNADLEGTGKMPGTVVPRNSYEADVVNKHHSECINDPTVEQPEARTLAHQTGPQLRSAECFESTNDNIAAALDNRNQAPPFKASRAMKKKINRVVDALIREVFPAKKIREWRIAHVDKEGNLQATTFEDMASKKWTQNRLDQAYDDSFAELCHKIEQEFMNKVNEVQDAGSKLPRPRNIIQAGDISQIKQLLPVKCFEDLLFTYFKSASIKKAPKHEAMGRVGKHLTQPGIRGKITTIEGDGSSWDACCNAHIRDLTENKIIGHIIGVLGFDSEVPLPWLQQCLSDMKKTHLRGKAKIIDFVIGKTRVKIDAIRQSGHRGTSCFNYLINLVNWLCVLCDNPEELIPKIASGKSKGHLQEKYISSFDQQEYTLRYAFEGDDSALTTTEDVQSEPRQKHILEQWTSLGFKMKLVFCENKMTFTGFDFLVDSRGPTNVFFPEVKRNIASCAWTTSPEVRSKPNQLHRVAAAMYLARAENFKDCEPLCHYFAALGKAHAERVAIGTNMEMGEKEASDLGIVPGAIVERLEEVVASTSPMSKRHRQLLEAVVGKVDEEKLLGMTNVHIDDPFCTPTAKHILPKQFWAEEKELQPRPRGDTARLLSQASPA